MVLTMAVLEGIPYNPSVLACVGQVTKALRARRHPPWHVDIEVEQDAFWAIYFRICSR